MAEDTPGNLAERLQGVEQLQMEVGGPSEEVLPLLRKIPGVMEVSFRRQQNREVYYIRSREGQDLRDEISRQVIGNGWSLLSMQMMGMSLKKSSSV